MSAPASVVPEHQRVVSPVNGTTGVLLTHQAQGYAQYPHCRIHGNTVYVSGISCRREDNTHEGVSIDPVTGVVTKDIRVQTRAVLRNIERILSAVGATLANVVDVTVFLVDMQDYKPMNEVYNEHFPDALAGPARTTIAVHQLPHPNLLIEIKCIAVLNTSTQ